MLRAKSKGVTITSTSSDSGESQQPQPAPRPPKAGRSRRPRGPLDRRRPWLAGKSIWNWLNLLSNLAIPVIVVTIGFGLWQAHQQQQSDQQHAQYQHKYDQQLARDQQHATILQRYIDNMQDLLLNHNLSKSKPADEIRQVAREQTLTTLRRLDAGRNKIVLRFLQDTRLIGLHDAVINLSDANLNGAYLFDATLYHADLNGAHLINATLTGAFLGNTTMNGATLTDAHLNGAELSGGHLNSSDLSGANLDGADLNDTDLSGTDLSYADLTAQLLTQQQLDKVYSCTHATLPTGLACHHSVSVTLTYWYTESTAEAPVIGRLIDQFQQLNPNIKINAVPKPFLQAQAAFMTAAQAGKAPDVFRSDVGWVTQLASQGYLLNIDSYVSQGNLSDYLSAPLRYDYYNGNFYGLPQVTDFLAMLYNKHELEKAGITSAPATMANFQRDAEKVVQSKAARYGFETYESGYYALPFLYAFGGGMFDRHNNILVNSRGSVNGLEFLLKLQNTYKVMPTNMNSSDGGNMVNDFMSGKTAMIFDGPWDVSNIWADSAFTGKHGNLGIAGIPRGPAGQTGSPLGGQSYVISAGTAHPFEAYKFISFMNSTASQAAIAEANHTLPTRQSAYKDRAVSSDPIISAFVSIKATAVARPAIPQAAHLFDAFDPNIKAALDGASPIDALNVVAKAWQQLRAGS